MALDLTNKNFTSIATDISISFETSSSNTTILETFTFAFCYYVDFPDSGIDCSKSNPQLCVKCPIQGRYLTSDSIGVDVLTVLLVANLIISIFGIFGNIFIVKVLGQNNFKSSFDRLITFLAVMDILTCFSAASAGLANTSYFGNKLYQIHRIKIIDSRF